MSQSNPEGGTKIAQAAKDLNVTSVTIRRYIQEFEIPTTADENGIKVLPAQAMQELYEIRRLKEEGLTNPKVMEFLGQLRENLPAELKIARAPVVREEIAISSSEDEAEMKSEDAQPAHDEAADGDVSEAGQAGKTKHSLTCQTCSKVFEHMNPRLRDCLDCYRAKRKERRRGGAEKHKNVIQHPLAQQAANKAQPALAAQSAPIGVERERGEREPRQEVRQAPIRSTSVRNYRKAIDETRHITSNLKRRLERPDLPEGERRWLEQIYAYQLILHQGWRHLAEYKQQGALQTKID